MANEKNSSCCNRYGNGWERLHYPAIKELEDKYEIVALCNRTRKDAEEFAKKINLSMDRVYDDYNEMLKRQDIDAVDILVPIESNYTVRKPLQKRQDFICEKPLAANRKRQKISGTFKKIQCKNHDSRKLQIQRRVQQNQDIVNSGKIGMWYTL